MPSDYPVFIIKAKDALAIPVITEYSKQCWEHGLFEQAEEVDKAIDEFRRWQKENINETKLPDHKHQSFYLLKGE